MIDTWVQRTRNAVLLANLILGFAAMPIVAQQPATPNLMPLPSAMQMGTGSFKIEEGFGIAFEGYHEPRLDRAGQRFMNQLHRQTGIVFAFGLGDHSNAKLVVTTERESKPVQELGEDESYTLDITNSDAKIHAATPLGAMHALQTFLQLVTIGPDGFTAPAIHIEDQPRFPWRGLMIDVARHFVPVEVLKRNLDGMEAVKLNVFHWHLSENQGFRAESRKFPKLVGEGSDGQYYTQEEMRDVIAYARDRGIRVVPEFDMPGHSTAWFVGHPELASGSGPYQIERRWGVFDPAMDPTNEKTYKFLNALIAEMAKLFPDHYFHIGGDEVNGKEWDANAKIQAYMKSHGMKNNEALQAYFSQRVQEIVVKHGKIPVGWDEILIPGVPKNIVIQSWRGADSLAAAAKQGYQAILSKGYYVDLGWSAAQHYAVDPMAGAASSLTPEQQKLILGGEACMWSEHVNAENIDSRIWPRTAAIAERLWSPQNTTDVPSMYRRMHTEAQRLEYVGLTHRGYQNRMIERMAGPASPAEFAAVQTFVQAVEPVKDYNREKFARLEATSRTALNRVVDAATPESAVARNSSEKVDEYLTSSCKDAAKSDELRKILVDWQGNDAKLQDLAQRSVLVKDGMPASAALSQIAGIGLSALDHIATGPELTDDQKKQQIDALNAAENQANQSQLTLPQRVAIQKLIEAAATGGACAAR